MNKKFLQDALQGNPNVNQLRTALEQRRREILAEIDKGNTLFPNQDLVKELMEINVALGDAGLDIDVKM